MTRELVLDPRDWDAVIFDMDGVITATARVHARAWKQVFDDYLRSRAEASGEAFQEFDIESDYRRYVDGKPRDDGVRSFLHSRGIELPEGRADDSPQRETLCGVGNRKTDIFLQRLREDGVEVFPDAVALVRELRRVGVHTAVISASRNARFVLQEAGVANLFETRVDGVTADEEGLEGKPAPDVFLQAARRVGADPQRCCILEDSLAGVEAGRAGGFGRVIGVARTGGSEALERARADIVLEDLSAITVGGTNDIEALPSALDRLDEIVRRIGDRQVALFLDFDGTLAPIVERPEDATIPPGIREVLAKVGTRRAVAIVSGRDLDDLRERVGLETIYYAGSHGFRMAGPEGWHREHDEARQFLPELEQAAERLSERLASIQGAQVERKRYAIAVHFRRAREEQAEEVRRAVEHVMEDCRGLRMSEGRKVLELRPDLDWDKGKALSWILDALGSDQAFPIYIGDDLTDEDAFRAVEGDGLGIAVRGREGASFADYALDDPDAVGRFLATIDGELQAR